MRFQFFTILGRISRFQLILQIYDLISIYFKVMLLRDFQKPVQDFYRVSDPRICFNYVKIPVVVVVVVADNTLAHYTYLPQVSQHSSTC